MAFWRQPTARLLGTYFNGILVSKRHLNTRYHIVRELGKGVEATVFLVHDTAGILHGDVNIGNIMIDATGEGVLCDLDDLGFMTTGSDKHAPLLRTVRVRSWASFLILTMLPGNLAFHGD